MASIIRTSLGIIMPAAVGATAAAATIFMLQSQPLEISATQVEAEIVAEVANGNRDDVRLEQIERELAMLKLRTSKPESTTNTVDNVVVEAETFIPPLDPEQDYIEQQVMKDSWLNQYAMEAVDINWAYDAEQAIELDLDRLRLAQWAGRDQIDFEVMGVNCRSNICLVEVEWDSAQTAIENGGYLAMHDYAQSCAVTVFGPAPDAIEAGGPFVQEIIFDCADFL